MKQFDLLISELSSESGLAMEIDDKDSCSLVTDGLYLTVQCVAASEEIVLFAPVDDPDSFFELSPAVMKKALSLSFMGDGTDRCFLGVRDDVLVLSKFLPLQNITAHDLGVQIQRFADLAISIKGQLAVVQVQSELSADEDFPDETEDENFKNQVNGIFFV